MPDDNSPVTRAEFRAGLDAAVQQLADFITASLDHLRTQLRQEQQEDYLRLAARLERAENALVAGFRTHLRVTNARSGAAEVRLAALEERVLRIEESLPLPPLPPDEAAPGQPS